MSSSSSRPYTPNQNTHPAYDRHSRSSSDREATPYRPSPLASTFRRQGSIRLRDDPAASAAAGGAAGSGAGTGLNTEDDEDDEAWLTKPWAHFSYSEIAARSWREMVFFPEYLYPQANRKPVSAARRRRLLFSYAPDWVITIVLWIACYLLEKIDGFRREFSITDTSLQHTFAVHERIPVWSLGLMCLFPLIFYIAIGWGIMRSYWDVHNAVLSEVLAIALTISVTTIVKVAVGRPRPDILDRCQPIEGAANAIPYGLVTSAICTTDNLSRLKEGFRSFPSGHASTAWAGLGVFGFYLAGKMHLFDQRGHTIKAWVTLVPFTAAALVSLSRVMDYRHHPTDIIAGSLLGLFFAWGSYRLYYPPLSHEMAHKPYSPRIPESEDAPEARRSNYGVDEYDRAARNSDEGPEGTLRRPQDGVGSGPIGGIPLRTTSSSGSSSPGKHGSGGGGGGYADLEAGVRRS